MEIIIRGKAKFGRTRSEQEENLRREGMVSLSDEQLDRLKFLEKRVKNESGSKDNHLGQHIIGGDSGIRAGKD
jgi:hypothetical protein